jgi:hypothetical protein
MNIKRRAEVARDEGEPVLIIITGTYERLNS